MIETNGGSSDLPFTFYSFIKTTQFFSFADPSKISATPINTSGNLSTDFPINLQPNRSHTDFISIDTTFSAGSAETIILCPCLPSRMITVGLITSEDIPEALKISLRELGSDYLSAEDFEEMIEPKDGFCMVARENGHVLGFSICKEFGPEEVDDRLRLPHSPEREMLLSKKKIGLLDSVSVSENARGLGVGRIMSEACLAQFERDGAEIMTAMAWEDVHGHANIDHILRTHSERPVPSLS